MLHKMSKDRSLTFFLVCPLSIACLFVFSFSAGEGIFGLMAQIFSPIVTLISQRGQVIAYIVFCAHSCLSRLDGLHIFKTLAHAWRC